MAKEPPSRGLIIETPYEARRGMEVPSFVYTTYYFILIRGSTTGFGDPHGASPKPWDAFINVIQ